MSFATILHGCLRPCEVSSALWKFLFKAPWSVISFVEVYTIKGVGWVSLLKEIC